MRSTFDPVVSIKNKILVKRVMLATGVQLTGTEPEPLLEEPEDEGAVTGGAVTGGVTP